MAIPNWITIATSDKSGGTGTSSTTKSISIKASENKSLSPRTGSLTFKPSHGASKTVSITQNAGVYSFGELSSFLTYSTDTVPASGGTLSSYSIWWGLPYGWNGNSSNAGTMTSSNYTNYSGVSLSSWSWSSNSSSVSVSDGKVTIPSAGTNESPSASDVIMADITATATLTIAAGSVFGNSSPISFTITCTDYVYRKANIKTKSAVELIAYQPDPSWHSVTNGEWDIVPASGAYIMAQKRYKVVYSSGEYEYTSPEKISTYNLEWSDKSMLEYHEWYGYDMTHVKSRGEIVGDALYSTCTYTEGDLSASLTFTQEANRLSCYYYDPVVSLSCADIPAGGGSVSSGTVSYSQAVDSNYTSGSQTKSTLTSGGTVSYSSPVTASSLDTEIKGRASVGELTVTVTMNGKSGSASATIYQEANAASRVYGDVVLYEYSLIHGTAHAGGGYAYSHANGAEQKITTTYTSGASTDVIESVSPDEYYIEIENVPSLGTTIKDKSVIASKLITWAGQGGKTTTATLYLYQEANKIESTTYGTPRVGLTPAQMIDVPASGASGGVQIMVNQDSTYTYTSKATSTTILNPTYTVTLIGVTDQDSASYCTVTRTSTGFNINIAKNNTSSKRSGSVAVNVSANGVAGGAEFNFSQLAGTPSTVLTSVPSSISALAGGGQKEITIYKEYDGDLYEFDSASDVTVSVPSWINIVRTQLSGGEILLVVRISNNTSTSKRSGSISVNMVDGSAALSIPVTQNGAQATSSNYSALWFTIEGASSVPSMLYEPLGIITAEYKDPDYGDYDCVPIGYFVSGTQVFNGRTMRVKVTSDTLKASDVAEDLSTLDDSLDVYLAAFPDGFTETAICIARIDSLSDAIDALRDVAESGDTTRNVTGYLV